MLGAAKPQILAYELIHGKRLLTYEDQYLILLILIRWRKYLSIASGVRKDLFTHQPQQGTI